MPTIRTQSADGQIHEFPDGTPPEVVDRAMQEYVQSKGGQGTPVDPSKSLVKQQRHPTNLQLKQPETQGHADTRRAAGASVADPILKTAVGVGAAGALGMGLANPVGLAGTLVGGYAGKHGGRFAAKELGGDEDVQDLAGWAGGALGGVAGGLGASRLEIPEKVSLPFGIKFRTPSWMNPVDTRPSQGEAVYNTPSWEKPSQGEAIAKHKPWGMAPEGEVVDKLKPWSKPSQGEVIDARKPWGMVPEGERVAQTKSWGEPATDPDVSPIDYAKNKQLNDKALNRRSSGTTGAGRSSIGKPISRVPPTRGSSIGTPITPPDDITVIPEPNEKFPGEREGYMASVPREELPGMADTGKPGAGKQLQQIGKKILYRPRPTIGRR